MFTGIVTEVGKVVAVRRETDRLAFRIEMGYKDLIEGESIAVGGACLTVVSCGEDWFEVEAIVTTRSRTWFGDLQVGDEVNLERSLQVGDRLGGHFVQGHVDAVGTVKTLSGTAQLIRQGQTLELAIGMSIEAEDRVLTSAGSSLGLILQDDTTVTLGPKSELLVSDYIFEPQQSRFSMVLKMLKGSFLYMSGVIGKLALESIKLETPDSTIAVRGTRLLIKVTP